MNPSDQATSAKTSDSAETESKGKHKTGKGSKQRRNDAFRKKKNEETFASIQAGIFARLKISDPTGVSHVPLTREIHPVVVPIGFRTLPDYIDRVWDTMESIGTRPFATLDTPQNKAIFTKGMLILSEAKVCFAQRAHVDKPDEELPSKKLYTSEELTDLNNMASQLPYPLAIYLESIGNCHDSKQLVTPVLAQLDNENMAAVSGAITFSPRQLLPLLTLLRDGVPENEVVHQIAIALNSLPNMAWEQFVGPVVPPAAEGPAMVRITLPTYEFWTIGPAHRRRIKWTDAEYRIFTRIVQSMSSKKGFNIACDLSHGEGSLAQVVQTPNWAVDEVIEWYTMVDVSEFDQKLGSAFGFCFHGPNNVQPSRFSGSYTTSYWRGEITPRRVMNSILSGQE